MKRMKQVMMPLVIFAAVVSSTVAFASPLTGVRVPAGFRTWKLETAGAADTSRPGVLPPGTVEQAYLPVAATIRLAEKTNLVLSTVAASSNLDESGDVTSLDGPSDIRAQLFREVLDGRLLVQAGVNIPTGKKGLNTGELRVSQLLGHPLLGFHVKHYGRGLDFNGGAAYSIPLSPVTRIGLGAGLIYHGAYTLREGEADFKPTPETSLSAGIELGARSQTNEIGQLLKLYSTVRFYGEDEQGSERIFEEGTQVEVSLRGRAWNERYGAYGSVLFLVKDDNAVLSEEGEDVQAVKQAPGTGVVSRAGINFALSGKVRLGVTGEWNHFSGSDVVGYNGDTFGAGPIVGIALGDHLWANVRGLFLTGSVDGERISDELTLLDTDLSGFAISVSLTGSAGS